MNWYYQRCSRTWLEFLGTLALLVVIWFLALVFTGLVLKVIWRVFMVGWNLV
jgi:phosphotransferase system  glucose/maltose/N-acetylglucosamine-specific IIC component